MRAEAPSAGAPGTGATDAPPGAPGLRTAERVPIAADLQDRPERFELTAWSVPATIEVRVDGVVVTGWTYAEADNAIVFDPGALPASGALETEYALYADCEP